MKSKVILIVASICACLVGLIIYTTFALIRPNDIENAINVTTNLSSPISFRTEDGNSSIIQIKENLLTGDNRTALVDLNDTLTLNLTVGDDSQICCNYDLYWVWDDDSEYSLSTGASNEFTIAINSHDEYYNSSNSLISGDITNIVSERQLPNTTTSELNLGNYVVCASGENTSKTVKQKLDINNKFYYIPDVDQTALKNKKMSGHVEARNATCFKDTCEYEMQYGYMEILGYESDYSYDEPAAGSYYTTLNEYKVTCHDVISYNNSSAYISSLVSVNTAMTVTNVRASLSCHTSYGTYTFYNQDGTTICSAYFSFNGSSSCTSSGVYTTKIRAVLTANAHVGGSYNDSTYSCDQWAPKRYDAQFWNLSLSGYASDYTTDWQQGTSCSASQDIYAGIADSRTLYALAILGEPTGWGTTPYTASSTIIPVSRLVRQCD